MLQPPEQVGGLGTRSAGREAAETQKHPEACRKGEWVGRNLQTTGWISRGLEGGSLTFPFTLRAVIQHGSAGNNQVLQGPGPREAGGASTSADQTLDSRAGQRPMTPPSNDTTGQVAAPGLALSGPTPDPEVNPKGLGPGAQDLSSEASTVAELLSDCTPPPKPCAHVCRRLSQEAARREQAQVCSQACLPASSSYTAQPPEDTAGQTRKTGQNPELPGSMSEEPEKSPQRWGMKRTAGEGQVVRKAWHRGRTGSDGLARLPALQ